MAIPDGSVVQGDGSKTQGEPGPEGAGLYLVTGGRRQVVSDVGAFLEGGHDPAQVQVISDEELESLPLDVQDQEMVAGQLITLSHYSFLGAGHYMRTYGALRKLSAGARIDATTRTWTITALGGFRGGVNVLFSDAQGFPVGQTQTQRFGVDGTWIGRSDRTDFWSTMLTEDHAVRTTDITIFHFWDPNTLESQVGRLVAAVKPLTEIIKSLVAIGASVATTKK